MFLKALTLRGFKSFPDKTTLAFRPGISVIVGPNGSGKSNLTEAVSWVLGEQGPRSLRGGRMEDVIFAGSKIRPALGMAEVTLTIDNSAGSLPIEFQEVAISRLLFRSGESEYRLNGAPCRLLDIQEVLSDSGIGRQQHTIIGQGELDEILQADPMRIRGFIEEAAGITKHRQRKDRALRKIGATEENISRLADLLSEIRRQLRPLRAQAEVAKRASALDSDLAVVLQVQASRELSGIRDRLGGEGGSDPRAALESAELELSRSESQLLEAEAKRTRMFKEVEDKREAAWSIARSQEKAGSLTKLASEKRDSLAVRLEAAAEGPLRSRASELEREKAAVTKLVTESKEQAESAGRAAAILRTEVEQQEAKVAEIDKALAVAKSKHRDQVFGLAVAEGEAAALEGSGERSGAEVTRLSKRRLEIEGRLKQLAKEQETGHRRAEDLTEREASVAERFEGVAKQLQILETERAESAGVVREKQIMAATLTARSASRSNSAAAARRIASKGMDGVVGVLADLVSPNPELGSALAAATGPPQGVVVVKQEAVDAVLAEIGADEQVGIIVSSSQQAEPVAGAESFADAFKPDDSAVARALSQIFLVADGRKASSFAMANPGYVFAAPDGTFATGAIVARSPSDTASAAAKAEADFAAAQGEQARIEAAVEGVRRENDRVMAELNEADAKLAATNEALAAGERELHALDRERAAILESEEEARRASEEIASKHDGFAESIPSLRGSVEKLEAELAEAVTVHEVAVRELRTTLSSLDEAELAEARAAERLTLHSERLSVVQASLASASASVAGGEELRRRIASSIELVERIQATLRDLTDVAARSSEEAEELYQTSRVEMSQQDKELETLRNHRAALIGAVDDLRAGARKNEAARSEFVVRARMIEERMRSEWGLDPDQAIGRYGHVWEVEDPARITEPIEKAALMEPDALARKRARLERDLEAVGRVNPMASQEFESLTERETHLGEQILDVRRSRRHLLKVVAEIDTRIREMFLEAYEDVAREYERLFSLLFPGGQGRLRLNDPDALVSGVEVEARPGGKNLRRLSLLSGGEKALSALAFLFAIFRARPSPFYVLDEVEAALDDVNLHRFLQLISEFRSHSQLLVVTHQKRTMEVGDVLYGVSIRADGASRVISERMPEQATPTARTAEAT